MCNSVGNSQALELIVNRMMSYKLQLLILFLFAFSTEAAVFTSPVQGNVEPLFELLKRHRVAESRTFHEVLTHRERRDRAQASIQYEDDISTFAHHGVEIWV